MLRTVICPVCQINHVITSDNEYQYALCDTHAKLKGKNYIALVETLSTNKEPVHLRTMEATGRCIHIPRDLYPTFFTTKIPSNIGNLAFISPQVYNQCLQWFADHRTTVLQ